MELICAGIAMKAMIFGEDMGIGHTMFAELTGWQW
jgi:hypothetical protein